MTPPSNESLLECEECLIKKHHSYGFDSSWKDSSKINQRLGGHVGVIHTDGWYTCSQLAVILRSERRASPVLTASIYHPVPGRVSLKKTVYDQQTGAEICSLMVFVHLSPKLLNCSCGLFWGWYIRQVLVYGNTGELGVFFSPFGSCYGSWYLYFLTTGVNNPTLWWCVSPFWLQVSVVQAFASDLPITLSSFCIC